MAAAAGPAPTYNSVHSANPANTHEENQRKASLIVTGKCLIVATVVTAFASAAIFSGGVVAAPMAISSAAVVATKLQAAAISIASIVGAVLTIGLAYNCNMHRYTANNLDNISLFIETSAINTFSVSLLSASVYVTTLGIPYSWGIRSMFILGAGILGLGGHAGLSLAYLMSVPGPQRSVVDMG